MSDFDIEGIELMNTHSPDVCKHRVCVLHNPTNHAMRKWRLHWRQDRGIFERLCPKHGVGHPDPDQFAYWREINQDYQSIHGCCGCCDVLNVIDVEFSVEDVVDTPQAEAGPSELPAGAVNDSP